jgi:Ca2+-binding EF-hand superfamily protein
MIAMNKLFLMAAVLGGMTMGSTAVMAHNHVDGDHKGTMMKKVDTNGDGVISKDEFLARHEEMFNKMDADGDGNLTPGEMKEARGEMREKMKERMEKRKEMKEGSDY